jgi:amino acid transporter
MSESSAESQTGGAGPPHGQLSLWDTVAIIVGIVIGSSIFATPTLIFLSTAGPWEALGIWAFCGFLSFIGALCYAELATTYPRYGGDYVYLTRAFDRPAGFLFGWSQLAVILSSSTGAMAFIFGTYGAGLLEVNVGQQRETLTVTVEALKKLEEAHLPKEQQAALAAPLLAVKQEAEAALKVRQSEVAVQLGIGAVLALTALNFFGVVLGKWVQNGLAVIKVLGLVLIIIAALWAPAEDAFTVPEGGFTRGLGGISTAMILVLYAFGGWNDAAFVAADLKDRRNIPKALLIGTLGITAIYLLVNFAYIFGIGFKDARGFGMTIAADVMTKAFGTFGGKLISVIVMLSALGAMNGLIFTGSRVYLSLGKEHRVFGILGYWNHTLKAPLFSLVAQAAVTIAMILTVGTRTFQDHVDNVLKAVGIAPIPWGKFGGGFDTLFAGGAPVFWLFFLMTGFSMFALRARDPKIERPFELKAPFYPVLPMIFCAMCLFGFFAAMDFAGWVSLLGFIPLALGLPLYWLSGKGHEPTVTAEVDAGVVDPVAPGAVDPVTPRPAIDERIQ